MGVQTAARQIHRALLISGALLLAACTPAQGPAQTSEQQTAPSPEPPTIEAQRVDAPAHAELQWVRANSCEDGAPMSLTASDGTGLRLASLNAKAVVEGPLAMTELRLSFDNPEDRQLEGRFAITLPPGAAISRFAMKIEGRWQEGEVVERQAARVAYEDFLHRRQDPALLEQDAGNVFRARVFPIPARARKELIVSYSQELERSDERYRLPICGLPTLDELDVDVAIVQGDVEIDSSLRGSGSSVYHLTLHREGLAPREDLEASVGAAGIDGVRFGELALARVRPVLETPQQAVEAMTILFDTSASRAMDFRGQVDRLGALVAALPPEAAVRVFAYDQDTVPIFDGRAAEFGTTQRQALLDRGALGASDLAQALDAVKAAGGFHARLLVMSDGVVTAGETETVQLQTMLRGLEAAGVERIDAVVDGGVQDEAQLAAITRSGLASDGVVLDARVSMKSIASRLSLATRSDVKVTVPGAEWVWPATLDSVQPGDERLVYAKLPADRAMTVELGEMSVAKAQPKLATVPQPLLARAHAQARIEALLAERAALPADDNDGRARIKQEIVDESVRHRVLSEFTALLVLETEADYARFGIERRSLADILTVGPSGVHSVQRELPPVVAKPPVVEKPIDEPARFPETHTAEAKKEANGAEFDDDKLSANRGFAFDDGEGQRAPLGGLAPGGDLEGRMGWSASGSGRGGGGLAERELDVEIPLVRRPDADTRSRPRSRVRPRPTVPPTEEIELRPVPSRPVPSAKVIPPTDPYEGRFATVMAALAAGNVAAAEIEAKAWRSENPGEVLALIALGEVAEASGRPADAARAYGSLIDLFPSRADIRRMAGERLERVGGDALALAIDTYAHGVEQRPDHPSSHRLYAYALLRAGLPAEAFAALEASLERGYPGGRFAGVSQVLREDLGLVGAAWIAADPTVKSKVMAALAKRLATLPTTPSTRFVLNWETDANDVDLHVYDDRGGHAYFSNRSLPSGGTLYADVTTGYGPECFTIPGKPKAGSYRLQAHYYSRGPMGYGMGKLQVVEHDGRGGLTFSEHPFVIQKDNAYVDLVTIGAKK